MRPGGWSRPGAQGRLPGSQGLGPHHATSWLLQLLLLYNGLPTRWELEPTSGEHPPLSRPPSNHHGDPLPSVDPGMPRTQSNCRSAFHRPPLPSYESKWFYFEWGLGRAVGGREKQLGAGLGSGRAPVSPHGHPQWAFLEQLRACSCLSFSLCTDRLVILLPVLAEGGALEKD